VNNIFVSCFNHNYQAHDYLNSIDIDDVLEIHLAGYTEKILEKGKTDILNTQIHRKR
jgi:uncharacterized protein (UPF0276 family)